MSRKWAIVLVAITFLSLGTLIGTVLAPQLMEAARPVEKAVAPKIAYVNIAKVLREYKKASAQGKTITAKKQEYADQIKPLREQLAVKSKLIQQTADAKEKAALQMEALALNRDIEDKTAEAERVLGEMSDRTIIEVYEQIHNATVALAKGRGLDVVECYPDASNPEDEKKPSLAQLKLQTPALIPYYVNKEFDLTESVLEILNKE